VKIEFKGLIDLEKMIYFILTVVILFYLIFTFNFALEFSKGDTCFTDKQKLVHQILIWVIPFFWIVIVKALVKPTPGSHEYKKKDEDGGFYESGLGG
jgi:hypothetical protein